MQKLQQKQISHEETPVTDEGTNPTTSEEAKPETSPASPKPAETPKPVETPKADNQPAETLPNQ